VNLLLILISVSLVQYSLSLITLQMMRYLKTEESERQSDRILNHSFIRTICKSNNSIALLLAISVVTVFTLTPTIVILGSFVVDPTFIESLMVVPWFLSLVILIGYTAFLTYLTFTTTRK